MAFIYAGIDLGTTSTGIVARFIRAGESLETTVIEVVLLPGSKNHQDVEAPQIALRRNGVLEYGKSVKGVVAEQPELQDEVLQLYKLALHPSFKTFSEVAHIHRVLRTRKNRGALQDLFTDLFKAFKRDILAYFQRETMDDTIDFNSIGLGFQISVPVMWGDVQTGIIRNAAKRAGVLKVELREESLCAATAAMEELHQKRHIKEGQCLLLLDIGGGTTDITVCQMVKEPFNGQGMELKREGMCSGDSVGSHLLNNELLKHLKSGLCDQIPRYQETCEDLHLTKQEFFRQCSEGFDEIKPKFDEQQKSYTLVVDGISSADKGIQQINITLSKELILGFFKKWIDANEKLLRNHIAHIRKYAEDNGLHLVITCAVFAGKALQCHMMRLAMEKVIREEWKEIKIPNILSNLQITTARGALMHHVFQQDSMPKKCYFYLARKEEFDPKKHTDVKSSPSKFDHTKQIVEERLRRIMHHKDGVWRPTRKEMTAMVFHVEREEGPDGALGRLHLDLYWSERLFLQSSPLRDQNGNIKDGIRSFPLVFADVGDLEKEGFSVEHEEDEEDTLDGDDGDDEEEVVEEDDGDEDEQDDDFVPESVYGAANLSSQRRSSARVREQRDLALQQMQTSARGDSTDDEDDRMEDQDSLDTSGEHYRRNFERRSEDDEDDDMSEKSDDSEDDGTDREHYRVKALIEMHGTVDKLDIMVYLMKPHYKFRWEHTREEQRSINQVHTRADLNEGDILAVHTDEVWSKDSSHFVSNTTGTSGPRGL